MRRGADREDMQGFLAAVDSIVTIEHETDEVERQVTAALMQSPGEPRQVFLLNEVARDLEGAADALMHTAFILRDHVLGEVMTT